MIPFIDTYNTPHSLPSGHFSLSKNFQHYRAHKTRAQLFGKIDLAIDSANNLAIDSAIRLALNSVLSSALSLALSSALSSAPVSQLLDVAVCSPSSSPTQEP